jgi:hypothetical protein
MNEFTCNWGESVILITILCFALLLFISGKSIRYLFKQKQKRISYSIPLLLMNFIIGFALIFTLLYMPLRIKLDDQKIYVDQVKSGFSIPYSEIIEIRNYSKRDNPNTIRVFGSSGLFGYIGKFENSQIGRVNMYVTDSSRRILIRTKDRGKNYVLSCKEPDTFIDKVKMNLNPQ